MILMEYYSRLTSCTDNCVVQLVVSYNIGDDVPRWILVSYMVETAIENWLYIADVPLWFVLCL